MEARPTIHPSADALRAFALGKLDEGTASVLMSHLDSCPDCCKEVASLSGDDFLARMRQAHGHSVTPAPARLQADRTRAPNPPPAPSRVPHLPTELANNTQYEILRELGRGGMGVVYLARNRLMDRLEVLKVINKTLLDRPGAVERFLREIRSAAKLSHTNVVAAYSAVQFGDLLAFAMEYVEGDDLAKVVKTQGPLPVAYACYYVQQAALGLQHAYEKKMVHRDIKPQNLILYREGKKHIIKVLDFGLAKATREKAEDTGLTGEGAMLGTPDYVAPEQSLDAAHADVRADIYSLGCTLYYLLTGAPPFKGRSLYEVLQAHHSMDARPLNLIRPEVPEELAAVVRKMMAKEPAKRYQTPAEVVQALSMFGKSGAKGTPPKPVHELSMGTAEQKGAGTKTGKSEQQLAPAAEVAKPNRAVMEAPAPVAWDQLTEDNNISVGARKSGAVRRGRRVDTPSSSRNKWLVGGSIGFGVLLLGLLFMGAFGVFKVQTTDGILIVEVNEENPEVFVDGEKVTVTWHNGGKKAEVRIKPGTRKVEVKKDGFTVYGEEVEIEDGKRRVLTAKLLRRRGVEPPLPAPEEKNTSDYDLTGGFRFVVFRPDGPRIAMRLNDGRQQSYFARVYDLATSQPLSPPLKHKQSVNHASFSPDGRWVVTDSHDRTAQVWDAETGQPISPPLKHEDFLTHASFSPDGKFVVTASSDDTARVWDAKTGRLLFPPLKHGGRVNHASFSPEGKRILTASSDNTARVWDAVTGQPLTPPLQHELWVTVAAFSPDGRRIITASWDKTARVWDAATGQPLSLPLKHIRLVGHAAFSSDGQRVVTASSDRTARVWDAKTGQPVTPPLPHDEVVEHASFSPDGKRVVTASQDKTARVWDAATGQPFTPPLKHNDHVFFAAFSPDGKQVVTISEDNTARLWDVETGNELKKATISAPAPGPPPAGASIASPSVEVLTPAQAAGKAGQKVTVQLRVQGTGKNAGGIVQLFSEPNVNTRGNFLIRIFPESTHQKYKERGIPDVAAHFRGKLIRVTGTVTTVRYSGDPQATPYGCIYIDDPAQIEVVEP